MSIQVRQQAPDFKAKAVINGDIQDVTLSQYQGKWVVLFFYPLDFTFVCPTEITAFSDRHPEFAALNAEILGVSVDSHFSHLAWINMPRNEGGLGALTYPLVADLTKSISANYGVLLVEEGLDLRGLFLIDPTGKLRYSAVHDNNVGRSVDETLRVLKAFQRSAETGDVCPANWTEGADTMKANPRDSKTYFAKHT